MTERMNLIVALSPVLGLRPGQRGWATDVELDNYRGHIELVVEDVPLEHAEMAESDDVDDPVDVRALTRRAKKLGITGILEMSVDELVAAIAGAEAEEQNNELQHLGR